MQFDHVALATDDVRPALEVLVGRLGGTVLSGGSPGAFRALQLRLGTADDGMNIELLEPWDLARSDFLRRFLDQHGEGPHHLTFKTDDIVAELARLRSLGLEPVGVQLESDLWREFFLHPSDGHGTVIQIAQLMMEEPPMGERMENLALWSSPWWPDIPRASDSAVLDRVVLGSPDPEATRTFFVDVLGGMRQVETISWGRDRIYVEASDDAGIMRLDVKALPQTTSAAGIDLVPV